ncbi:sensor histidine kinase [Streptomyces sp. SL13]|uniref:Sensor histidine kinase n=1 Tax=Streptantibioticus silvisoli TaxID=2705255 RepID=A0AA90H358_9ACTN|nr:sensor histidine kinase [Streptantibioticus silvisoli]MDI5970456.1 sensor histidine kinase [Streptantibioticus silvisoli]
MDRAHDDTVTTAGTTRSRPWGPGLNIGMGMAPESRRQQMVKLCWTLVYLLYLAGPVADLLTDSHTVVAGVLGWAGLTAFVLPYLYLVLGRRVRDGLTWRQVGLISWLYALAAALTLSMGQTWLVLFVYVTVGAGVLLPLRHGAWAVPFAACSLLGAGALVGASKSTLVTMFLPALMGGAAMMGVAGMGRTMRELREARETVAELAANEERLRLARDLHDLLGHSLSLITLKSELTGRMLPDRPEEAARQVADIERVSRQALVDVREAVSGYRRPTLAVELAGVRTALRTAGVHAEIAPALDTPVSTSHPGLGAEEESALAWALREAITNVVRHSGAKHCDILLDEVWDSDERRYLRLEVADDGRGPARVHRPGNGLSGLGERLCLSGGLLRTGRSERGGFSVRAQVPLRAVRPPQEAPGPSYPQA